MEFHYSSYNCSLYLRIGYIICRIQCSQKMQNPMFKIIKNFKVVAAEHCTKHGAHYGCASHMPIMLSLTTLGCSMSKNREENPALCRVWPVLLSDITQNVASFSRAVLFFLTFLLDWNNGRPLYGKHNLCPQFFQACGKYKHHAESLLLSMGHLIHHGHGLPGCQRQHCRPDGQSKFLLKLKLRLNDSWTEL